MGKVEYSTANSNDRLRQEPRDKMQSMIRGARDKCPSCGKGSVFSSFLKVAHSCNSCEEELHHERSDDAAPYFTIFIIGHIMIPLVVLLETYVYPPYWLYGVILLPLLGILTLLILPRVKGTLVGLQWALYMHGFDKNESTEPFSPVSPEIIGQK